MKYFTSSFIIVFCLFFFGTVSAQNAESVQEKETVKLVQYIIRKGDYVINVAKRFHVSYKELVKVNKFKNRDRTIYPGRKLLIPVKIKEKVWSPESDKTINPFLTKEDARPQEDFEIDMDSVDTEVKEDFVTVSDVDADSIQHEKISKHISKIDKRINYLNHKLDSIKQDDLNFQFDENDKNSILQKMKLARDRFYSSGPIGREIDSLNKLRGHLGEENTKIKSRLTEYEYLAENAEYFAKNKGKEDNKKTVINEWGGQIVQENKYETSKVEVPKKKGKKNKIVVQEATPVTLPTETTTVEQEKPTVILENPLVAPPTPNVPNSIDSVAKITRVDTVKSIATTKSEQTKTTTTPAITSPSTSKKENTTIPNSTTSNPTKTENPNTHITVIETHVPQPSIVKEETTPVKENKSANEETKTIVTNPSNTTVKKSDNVNAAATTAVKSKEIVQVKIPAIKTEVQKKTALDNAPKQKNIPVEMVEVKAPIKTNLHTKDTVSNFKQNISTALSADSLQREIGVGIDSSVLRPKAKKVSDDPLASYITDSNFVMTTVAIKDITVMDYRHRPKYLMPVDSVHRIKAEFFLIRARKALEQHDFKEGEKMIRKSLDLNPNYAAAWMLHADLYAATGAPEKAVKEYLISTEIDSTNPKAFYNLALLFGRANNSDKAYTCYSKALQINDKYLLAYLGRASLLIDQRDYNGAIDDYTKVIEINRYYSLAYKGRGLARMEAHDFAGAVLDFNQYLEIEDPDGYILYQRGISKVLSNQLLQGCLDFSSSLELGFKQADKAIKKFCQ